MVPTGDLNHLRIATLRPGRAARRVAAWESTRRRAVRSFGRTSSRVTETARHPRSRATSRPSRPFRSRETSIAWRSGTTDLTSTTRSEPVAGWNPRTSIDPRSPRMLNEASGSASQPFALRRATAYSTRLACLASRRRSRPSPCHRSRSSTLAPRAVTTLSRVCTATRSAPPRSMRPTTGRDKPALTARSSCDHRRRRRSARTPSPKRTTSTERSIAGRHAPRLIPLSSERITRDLGRTGQPRKRRTLGATAPATRTTAYPTSSASPARRCSLTLTPMTAINPYGLL